MQRFLTITLLLSLCTAGSAAAQKLDPAYYVYPVKDVSGYCSANFGEMRPDHFHSGIDIKTDGVEGKRVVAVADGYISRIADTPSGYGRALYVSHPNGTTSVYGHLSRFRGDIDSIVLEERYRSRRNSLNIYCKAGEYPVKQGEVIAFSGNTGNSFGPHLHFEIRDSRTSRTLNTIEQGVIRVQDTIAPIIRAVYYAGIDSVGRIPVHAPLARSEVRSTGRGEYTTDKTVKVGPKGYFVLEVTDRKNGVQNTFGVYRVTAYADSEKLFEYRMDGYTFDMTRYCNAVSFYPMQVKSKNEVIRLAMLDGTPQAFCTASDKRGLIYVGEEQRRSIRIEVEDDCHNISVLRFDVEGGAEPPSLHEIADTDAIYRDKPFRGGCGDISIEIPAGALYESAEFVCGPSQRKPHGNGNTAVLSPAYDVMRSDIPMQKAATVTIKAFIPDNYKPHVALAAVAADGKVSYVGGEADGGGVTGRTSRFGTFCVVADTIPPTIQPVFKPGSDGRHDMRRAERMTFRVSDNFSGIKEYSATIDGKWVALDRSPVKGTVFHRFDHHSCGRNAEHEFVMRVTDNCGNKTTYRMNFFR